MKLKLKVALIDMELSIEVLDQVDFAHMTAIVDGRHEVHIRNVSYPEIVAPQYVAQSILYVKGAIVDKTTASFPFPSTSEALLYLSHIIYALEANGFVVSVDLSGDITV